MGTALRLACESGDVTRVIRVISTLGEPCAAAFLSHEKAWSFVASCPQVIPGRVHILILDDRACQGFFVFTRSYGSYEVRDRPLRLDLR